MSKISSPQKELDNLLKIYLDNVIKYSEQGNLEMEVRFGTARGMKPIKRQDYDNVVHRLLSAGFQMSETKYLLRMQNEFIDVKTGLTKQSNLRTEISGIGNIADYCKTNQIQNKFGEIKSTFIQKNYLKNDANENINPVNFNDFNFRVTLQNEKNLSVSNPIVKGLVNKWTDTKKIFRYTNRNTLTHNELPVNVDISIVKESKRKGYNLIPSYLFADSGVNESGEKYEIEIEVINEKVGFGTPYSTPALLEAAIKKTIKLVMSGLQSTNFPVSYVEQKFILNDYMQMLWKDNFKENTRVFPKNFVGPSSYTLQMKNIAPINPDSIIPNIRTNYTVTDKADGIRKLLYISKNGKIYLIDQNMNVQFTGAITKKNHIFNTLLDGEHILQNKDKKFINLYAAFDIYYLKDVDIRSLGFTQTKADDVASNFRLTKLASVISELAPQNINKASSSISPIRIERKTFYSDSENSSIFQGCAVLLQKAKDGLFEYETDGLIFTPSNTGVGSDKIGETTKPIKVTWTRSFKWKPPQFNTNDFLITTKKTPTGQDFIGNIFQNGLDTSTTTQLTQYKTVILRVGFDEALHGYINPCQNILNNDIPKGGDADADDDTGYRPMQFFPSNPSDENAGICNILLRDSPSGDKVMYTHENEVIEDNTIVEFSYDLNAENQWNWKPLRVRYDKTADFRAGGNNFGNAYHVANSNWHSIHNPITSEMLTSGENIPDELADDDVYYNRISGSKSTKSLRDFHNLFVKKQLITGVSRRGDTLIDLAAGKGGDIPKWIASKLKFVFGIDLARDNITNRLDGICARYLNYRKKFKNIPDALFVNGNASVNIRNTDGILTDKGKQITRAVFGQGPKDVKELGEGVYKQYGKGEDGFNICSIQFAIHYMFENQVTLQNFLRNVSETTKVGGYFIGTSYDGASIFNMLKSKQDGENYIIMDGDKKIWELTKRYDRDEFSDNSSSLGYAVDVYQESINKTFREYLVNYTYLDRLLEDYGFVKLTREEALENNLPASTGFFRDLFGVMKDEIKRNYKMKNEYGEAPNMSAGEREISFLNRYFVYKKVRSVNAESVANAILSRSVDEDMNEEDQTRKAQEAARLALMAETKTTVRKTKRKLKLKT